MPDKTTTTPPVPEYDLWSNEQIAEWLASARDEAREAAIAYEAAHQNRPEVLELLGATPEE